MGSGAMSGVVTRQYKAGSIVYFEGDKSDCIFILKSGRVVLNYLRPETGEEIKEDIKAGEFFGVKSALGKYPREETAQTLTDTVVLQLRLDDFERIVLSNVQVVKKMLRVFSNQLRRIGRAVREVLGETSVQNPSAELFKIAEYYFRNSRTDQALYAYKKYLEYYPNTQFSQMCMDRVKDIQSGNFTAGGDDLFIAAPSSDLSISAAGGSNVDSMMASFDASASAPADGPSDMVDFEFDDNTSASPDSGGLSGEMDNFLAGGSEQPSISSKVDDAKRLLQNSRFPEALAEFGEIKTMPEPTDPFEHESWEDAHFQMGACHYAMGSLKEAMTEISTFMRSFPNSKFVKNALLYAGYIYEKAGSRDKAVPYYKKAASMQPKDDISAQANNRLKALGAV
jgi:CRP-like cAMP-binding protein/TolA-binding protein